MKESRPWGTYEVLATDPIFKIKRITVHPGHQTSLQSHQYRSEHWVILEGTATVTHENRLLTLGAQSSIFIKAGEKHRLSNQGNTPLTLIEIQTGTYFGEEDIIRFKDDYGREE
jgi:mannose-1-phosphate guanylyltransferase/mannose-6-phosphate isomerase